MTPATILRFIVLSDSVPWFYLGVASNEMGKKAQAKAALTRFIQLCPRCGYNSSYAKQILKSIK